MESQTSNTSPKTSKRDAIASQDQPRGGARAPRSIEATPDSSLPASQSFSRSVLGRRNGSSMASPRRREEGKHQIRDVQGDAGFPNMKTHVFKVRTSIWSLQSPEIAPKSENWQKESQTSRLPSASSSSWWRPAKATRPGDWSASSAMAVGTAIVCTLSSPTWEHAPAAGSTPTPYSTLTGFALEILSPRTSAVSTLNTCRTSLSNRTYLPTPCGWDA